MSIYSTALNGLVKQSSTLGAIAQNVANINSTGRLNAKAGERQAYVPVDPLTLSPKAQDVIALYSPDSADADADGFIAAPDISLEEQLTGALIAKDSYIANAKMIKTQEDMERELLNIIS